MKRLGLDLSVLGSGVLAAWLAQSDFNEGRHGLAVFELFMVLIFTGFVTLRWLGRSIAPLQAIILEALMDDDSYGLELIRRTEKASDGRLHQGNIYPMLRAFERQGLLTSYDGKPLPERGRHPRRYYQLTAEGRRWVTQYRAKK